MNRSILQKRSLKARNSDCERLCPLTKHVHKDGTLYLNNGL